MLGLEYGFMRSRDLGFKGNRLKQDRSSRNVDIEEIGVNKIGWENTECKIYLEQQGIAEAYYQHKEVKEKPDRKLAKEEESDSEGLRRGDKKRKTKNFY